MNIIKQGRQGDVLLIAVDEIPANSKDITPVTGPIILKHGEATGHTHALHDAQDARMYVAHSGARYLVADAIKALNHEEHDTMHGIRGKYLLPEQVEYSPAELRNVAD